MTRVDLQPHRIANGPLELGPFAVPPTYQEQQAMTLFAATAITKGYIVAHVRDDNTNTVRIIASEVPRG